MSAFKWRHFEGEIVLWAVRWYCRYGVSYRDLEEMLGERGVGSTTRRSIAGSSATRRRSRGAPLAVAPAILDQLADRRDLVKVRGKWAYLYRAVDKDGNTIDFYLSPTRNTAAAKRFLGKALNGLKDWEKPRMINTDKAPTYGTAIAELKKEGKCPEETCIGRSSTSTTSSRPTTAS